MGYGLCLGAWWVSLGGERIDLAGASVRLILVLLCHAGFTLLQRSARRVRFLHAVAMQANLLMLGLLLMLFLSVELAQAHRHVLTGVLAASVFLAVAIGLKLIDLVAFDWSARWRRTTPVPLVLRDIGRWLLALGALILIVRGFFPGLNLNVLAVSSLVVGYIVGNATQDTLGNLISGVALNAERPFHIGDWVTVSGHTGVVVDTTWRATRLRTRAEDYIVIPNSSIAKEPILNFSRPTRSHGCYATIGLDYDTPPNKARHVILDTLKGITEVLREPAPCVYLSSYADFSINFRIKYFIDDYARLDAIESLVMDRLWYAFKREGISIPFPVSDVRMRNATQEEVRHAAAEQEAVRALLAQVDLLRSLNAEELTRLAASVRSVPYAEGETLVRQGEPGETFYVVRQGRVSVLVAGADGRAVSVAQLGPGAFFGEMSLLTGEARSATVRADTDAIVLTVSKAMFAGLLQSDPALAERLAAVLEARQADRQAKLSAQAPAGAAAAGREPLLLRIRRFFGLS